MQFINRLAADCDVTGALHSDCTLFFADAFVRLFTRPYVVVSDNAYVRLGLGTRLVKIYGTAYRTTWDKEKLVRTVCKASCHVHWVRD